MAGSEKTDESMRPVSRKRQEKCKFWDDVHVPCYNAGLGGELLEREPEKGMMHRAVPVRLRYWARLASMGLIKYTAQLPKLSMSGIVR